MTYSDFCHRLVQPDPGRLIGAIDCRVARHTSHALVDNSLRSKIGGYELACAMRRFMSVNLNPEIGDFADSLTVPTATKVTLVSNIYPFVEGVAQLCERHVASDIHVVLSRLLTELPIFGRNSQLEFSLIGSLLQEVCVQLQASESSVVGSVATAVVDSIALEYGLSENCG